MVPTMTAAANPMRKVFEEVFMANLFNINDTSVREWGQPSEG